jgi:UDP-N-acetylmuramyl pentapeptide synthase
MNIKEASKILVLDPIHGAEVIADELEEVGKEVEIFNPYRNPFLDQTFSKGLDLVIAPVHLNPEFEVMKEALNNNIPFMSHHEAVKEIAAIKTLFTDIKVVEVTGTVGKTAVCELICQLLKNKFGILSHTSSVTRFKSAEKEVRFPRIGGTPANVLKVMRIAREKNLKPDIAVFEISLGLTGIGDVGVITSLEADYRIAGGTKDASAAKKDSIKNYEGENESIVVHPGLLISDGNVGANTFGDKDKNLWIDGRENKVIFNRIRTTNGDFISGEIPFKPFDLFSGEYYKNSLEAAFCTVLSLDIPPEEVNTENISAVKGRMKLEKLKGRFLIDNSNSGTKLKFLDEITEMARRISEKIILIVGEESQYVCEGVSVEELKQVVARASDFVEIIIVGEEFKGKIESENVVFSDGLDAALEKAINDSEEGFVIISNVKTWR